MMYNLWRFLSGDVPGGFTTLLVVVIAFWAIWEYVYRIGGLLSKATYQRWRTRGPFLLLLLYLLVWIQSPPKREPLRIAVIASGGACPERWSCEALADLAARRLRGALRNAIVNPWEGATNYPPPAADRLEKASYRVFRIGCDTVQAGRALHYNVSGPKGSQQAYSATGPAILELSAQVYDWILADLGKKRAYSSAFHKEPSADIVDAYYRGRYQLNSGQADSAYNTLSAAVYGDSEFVPALILLARSAEAKGQQQEAYAMLLNAVRADSGSQEALLALGECYLRGYEWEGAEAALKVVLSKDPLPVRALVGLARIHPERLKDLRLKSPRALLEEAMRLDPAYEIARLMLADLLADKGLPEAARQLLQEGLRINPESQDLLLKLGGVEIQLGHPEAARSAYEEILKKDPLNAIAIFNLGVVDYRTKQYDRAIQRFETVQGLSGPVDCYYYLGLIYRIKGDNSRAKFFFQRRWELRANDDDAFGIRARLLAAQLDSMKSG